MPDTERNERGDQMFDERLRRTETKAAETEAHLKTLFHRFDEVRQQLTTLIEKIDASLIATTRVSSMEAEVTSIKSWVGQHTQDFATLLSEHRMYCAGHSNQQSWLKDRAGRLLDWAIPAVVIWLLFIFRTH